MTDGLFSAVALEDPEHRAGFRLHRLEIYNWGTFNRRVWNLDLGGSNGLLTGDIGSGKSTMVDAITTLLLPANRISYNKAAGAETRERSLRSYVLGFHKSESNEVSGTSRPIGVRSGSTFSVLLGTFSNEAYNQEVTLAQVFWLREGQMGQPDRFFVVADRAMTITADFADFGADIAALKRRLRKTGARTHDHFPEYGRDFRRQLGIESEQAMDLFHQTVSMKSVGNLNDFVRSHMLEPFDADQWIDRLVAHFEDLTRSHEAVLKARAQLTALQPLLADCDQYEALGQQIHGLSNERAALPFYLANLKQDLLRTQIAAVDEDLRGRADELAAVTDRLADLRSTASRLEVERAGHGGHRLAEIEREIAAASLQRDQRQLTDQRFAGQLADAGLAPVGSLVQFTDRRTEIASALLRTDEELAGFHHQSTALAVEKSDLDAQAAELGAELASLHERRNNIPRASLELRALLARSLQIGEDELPFAGELIAVRDDHHEWEGAAERVLHSFGLSLLIPDRHYQLVSGWINDHHLKSRLVYFRMVAGVKPAARPFVDAGTLPLYASLVIKESTPFYGWLEAELFRRANYVCVDDMTEFRRERNAVTREGLIKSDKRHEKDDRRAIGDRRSYVLGWDNQQKIDALLDQMTGLQSRLNALADRQRDIGIRMREATARRDLLTRLDECRDFTQIDWHSAVNRISGLAAEQQELQRSSRELRRLTEELQAVQAEIEDADAEKSAINTRIGGLERDRAEATAALASVRGVLEQPAAVPAAGEFPRLEKRIGNAVPESPAAADRLQTELSDKLTSSMETRMGRQNTLTRGITTRMADFRREYPLETADVDNSVASAGEYRELHRRLAQDDLPRFESEFKTYLNTNTIRDIAMFSSKLGQQLEQIKERIQTINDSLYEIDYNPDRYIRLDRAVTPNTEIREFRSDLRACTDDAVSADDSDQYSEQKFLQVKAIVERFKGRQGQTEADRLWSRRVTDVRNWFLFSASERWRETDAEYENYTDSGGKSGGQKEKLAYTILAASLAYQFKLQWGAVRSKTFRFAVIDEAFGRGSESSTRFALDLFRKLGLQLLIVTPLQKIHVIEPYVAAVGFVDNLTGDYSRLQNLTIEEYRARQLAHALGAAGTPANG